jgi:sulfur carrier protein ThiS
MFKSLACIGLLALMPVVANAGQRDEKVAGVTATGVLSSLSTTHNGVVAVLNATVASSEDFGTPTVSYNQANESAATSGWINVEDYNDDIVVHVDLSVLGSTGVDVTLEGLLDDVTDTPIILWTESFASINTGYSRVVGTNTKYFRVGGQATGTDGTDTCTIKVRAEGRRK